MLPGLAMTMVVSLSGLLLGMLFGLAIALLRLLPNRMLQAAVLLVVNVFQSIPVLAILLWVYYALPMLTGYSVQPVPAGIGVLALFSGAYLSEAFRAGILSINKGQWDGARALGMRNGPVMRRIILPQAFVQVLPPITGIWVSTIKESALVSAISVEDLMYRASSLAAYTLRPVESFTVAAAIYFAVLYPFIILAGVLYRRMRRANGTLD